MSEIIRDEVSHLAVAIRALERQLEVALAKRRVELSYEVHDGVVRLERKRNAQAVLAVRP